MTFRDIKYPKELARKKKLELYKCFILEPLKKKSPKRTVDVDVYRERWALTEKQAVQYALNQLGIEDAMRLLFNQPIISYEDSDGEVKPELKNRDTFFVIMSVTLKNGVMDEEIIVPTNEEYTVDVDPNYDPDLGLLTATIKDRYDSMHIKNYTLHDIYVTIEPGSNLILIDTLEMDEVVVNSLLTGEK